MRHVQNPTLSLCGGLASIWTDGLGGAPLVADKAMAKEVLGTHAKELARVLVGWGPCRVVGPADAPPPTHTRMLPGPTYTCIHGLIEEGWPTALRHSLPTHGPWPF